MRHCAAHDLIGRVATDGVARPVVDPYYTATVGLARALVAVADADADRVPRRFAPRPVRLLLHNALRVDEACAADVAVLPSPDRTARMVTVLQPWSSKRGCPGGHGVWVLWAEDPLDDGQQRGELVPGPDRISRRPGPIGEVGGVIRVSGWPGPDTRSRMGSSAASWSRAPAASPAFPVQWARLCWALRVAGCSLARSLPSWSG